MSALAPSADTFSTRLVSRASGLLSRRISRRGLIARLALVGSALAASGTTFVLRPGTAYSAICGSGSSCSSGWTAMCCTINQGVNQCPPGTFAGGWWKATGASLCGGKARYIVDCQAKCEKCGCGRGNYCKKKCWSCKPGCAKGKGCDKRRACWNVFRYGQCDRQIRCSGPVACRAVSCTPPWKWENCSTASATDNRTRHHSSTCLPTWSPINKKYVAMGSEGSVLGATIGRERKGHRGRVQRYTGGRMYRGKKTGIRYLTGAVLTRYRALGESDSPVGLPVTNTRTFGDTGTGADFQRGAVYAARGRKAFALWGPVWTTWVANDAQSGVLGYPLSDRTVTGDGAGEYAQFEKGVVLRGPGLPAVAVHGEIGAKYLALGYENSELGYPVGDRAPVSDVLGRVGALQPFQRGSIAVTPLALVAAVWGAIHTRWKLEGGEAGALGFPTTDVVQVDASTERCDFDRGYITLDRLTGETTVVLN
jgi:hypothetical protein